MSGFGLGPALLFCPADRPDRFASALERADAVILDLEDAVAPHRRAAAREAVVASRLDPARVIVRVNRLGTADAAADLAALTGTPYRTVMVPKADAALAVPEDVAAIALCETAAGVLDAPAIARRPGVLALMWGAEDLVASLGGTASRYPPGHPRAGAYRDVARHARTAVLLAAGAAGIAAIDTVHLEIADLDGLREEAEDAVASGFAATACIHPSQVPIIRTAYAPTPTEAARARAILDAAAEHEGVFALDGRMIDAPVLRHAEAVLRRLAIAEGGGR